MPHRQSTGRRALGGLRAPALAYFPYESMSVGTKRAEGTITLTDFDIAQPGQIMPTTLLPPHSPRIFRPSYGSYESFKLSPSVACETDVQYKAPAPSN